MQIVINIKESHTQEKILWMLEHFKEEGVEIQKIADADEALKTEQYTEDYIKSHWKEIIMSVGSDDSYYKSEQYKLDRGADLAQKYK